MKLGPGNYAINLYLTKLCIHVVVTHWLFEFLQLEQSELFLMCRWFILLQTAVIIFARAQNLAKCKHVTGYHVMYRGTISSINFA